MESLPGGQHSRNWLLTRFPASLREQITSGGQMVVLQQRQVLCHPDQPAAYVYFPLDCLISIVMTLPDGEGAELMTAGPEGMLGVYALLRDEIPFFEAVVQAPGRALRYDVHRLRDEVAGSRETQDLLLGYASFLVRQMALQVVCNAVHRVEQRCCRWLLTTSQKLGTRVLPLTHEYLASVLGVRRPGLTVILGQLQKAGLLRQHRGRIELLDSDSIAGHACECHDILSDHYMAVVGAR